MRILYCNPTFWEYRLPFYVELNRLFHGDFHILYSAKRFLHGHVKLLDRIENEMGVNAHPYKNELMYDVKSHSFHGLTDGGKQIPLPFGLWKQIKRVKPDVLITEGFFQWTPIIQLYGMVHHIPVFMGYERTMHTERNNSKLKTWIRKIQDKKIAGYLVNGSETKKYLESIGVSSDKIFIGGMSADSKGLRDAIAAFPEKEKVTFKARFKRGEHGIVYLFSGRVEVLKGAPHLLDAWKDHIMKYPDDSLILIGMGESFEDLKSKFGSYESVFLEGRVDYESVYKYYAIADVFILPTLQDNWSLVIPEAMSCGLPVATSVYNGCYSELIKEGENGCVFDPLRKDSLIKALDYFHHVDLKKHGECSIEIEKNFNTEHCALREFEGINKVLLRFGGGNELIFLFTGQLIERKGIVPLLEVWMKHIEQYPNDSLVVVGDGELYDTCKAKFGQVESIYLEGGVEYEQIYRYYAIADVYILPTIEDNWSLVIPEAMSCGLPVATSIYNGCHPELVHEGENGIVFDTFKQESMINALDYFHHHNLKAMGQKSIELEKPFNTDNCARRVYEAIAKVLNISC